MKFILFSIPIYILSTFSAAPILPHSPEFELIKEGNGIHFFERWITMEDGTKSREVKFLIEIQAPSKNVLEVLTKEKFGAKWNENSLDYKIKASGKQSWISYIKYSFPFPLSDRECYLYNQLVENKDGKTIFFKSSESRIFSNEENIVQMEGLKGRWVITEGNEHTLLRYHIISVPEEGLPRWIVDPIIRKNLWATMENLKRTIEEI
ncbi:hypothetical protein [Cyclobacterium qasimii]|uniref:START domain-containing protein n=2 Tax=Cyclobacterium qasimii TaxID=1350429 RepID=S7V6G1_9BACT|nr:hypothetical protein [Cyclobacterium qasimii]EPR65172.1 hypothetical protein ADICYQ_5705 [Cyclobacterium qasimii M12-11B]GEO22009.1 hypothetical protein CQA01_25430 [Cyclobacterium qasimii]